MTTNRETTPPTPKLYIRCKGPWPQCGHRKACTACPEYQAGIAIPSPAAQDVTPSITAPMESAAAPDVTKPAAALSRLAELDGETMDLSITKSAEDTGSLYSETAAQDDWIAPLTEGDVATLKKGDQLRVILPPAKGPFWIDKRQPEVGQIVTCAGSTPYQVCVFLEDYEPGLGWHRSRFSKVSGQTNAAQDDPAKGLEVVGYRYKETDCRDITPWSYRETKPHPNENDVIEALTDHATAERQIAELRSRVAYQDGQIDALRILNDRLKARAALTQRGHDG